MKRIYENILGEHFATLRQMAFLSGPRQAGKTTLARATLPDARYLSYDAPDGFGLIQRGGDAIATALSLSKQEKRTGQGSVIFDEIHKFSRWKKMLKGFFDVYGDGRRLKIAVTGSARLNIYKRGGDSLMGRYFLYRVHPLSAGEIASSDIDTDGLFRKPVDVPQDMVESLLALGGYPEPFLNGTLKFRSRWQRMRLEQLFREDLRDLSRVQDVRQIQRLSELLASRVSGGINVAALASDIGASQPTVSNWLSLLESVFFSYEVRPWHKNVASSIRKQPKIYLWDWSQVADEGARRENFVASHLLKAVHWWTDCGIGEFELCYLRDKMQREVDFLVVRDGAPFMLVECKSSFSEPLSPALLHFKDTLGVPLAWQVAFDTPQSSLVPDESSSPSRIGVADLLKILP
ncbi:MAG: ATP-binding protein [Kiritimatiellae bacterium]|nr:ATP-binding protein [Kiritimatiellia bacterium]MBQ3344553.1 ATP-binding protein [Kiritimatiellia bacterium]MBQ6328519.1 ATP-binding protein [Kiritimatiellia bacterium]